MLPQPAPQEAFLLPIGAHRPCCLEKQVFRLRRVAAGCALPHQTPGSAVPAALIQRHAQHGRVALVAGLGPAGGVQRGAGFGKAALLHQQHAQGHVQACRASAQADGPPQPPFPQDTLSCLPGRHPAAYQHRQTKGIRLLGKALQLIEHIPRFIRRVAERVLGQIMLQAVDGGFRAAHATKTPAQFQPGRRRRVIPGQQPVNQLRSLLPAAHVPQLLGQMKPAQGGILLLGRPAQKLRRLHLLAAAAVFLCAPAHPPCGNREGHNLAQFTFAHAPLLLHIIPGMPAAAAPAAPRW